MAGRDLRHRRCSLEQATQDQYATYSARLDIWDRRPIATITTDDVRQLLAEIDGFGARRAAFKV